jgi:hypothetical protein
MEKPCAAQPETLTIGEKRSVRRRHAEGFTELFRISHDNPLPMRIELDRICLIVKCGDILPRVAYSLMSRQVARINETKAKKIFSAKGLSPILWMAKLEE